MLFDGLKKLQKQGESIELQDVYIVSHVDFIAQDNFILG